jgi:Co/Zn/Cd efflux system component
VYGLALYAVGRPPQYALRAARPAGVVQFVLAAALLVDVLRRAVTGGVDPLPGPMVVVTLLALAVNIESTRLTARHRGDGVHLRAAWIFSAADVLGNVGVLLAAALVAVTGQVWPDLVVGTAVALGVAAGAWSILRLR